MGKETFERMRETVLGFTEEVLGLKQESTLDGEQLLQVLLDEYKAAKDTKNYDKVDELRAKLKAKGIVVKDMKNKVDWALDE